MATLNWMIGGYKMSKQRKDRCAQRLSNALNIISIGRGKKHQISLSLKDFRCRRCKIEADQYRFKLTQTRNAAMFSNRAHAQTRCTSIRAGIPLPHPTRTYACTADKRNSYLSFSRLLN